MSDLRRLISPVAATLLRAADYIEEHGWCQGEPRAADGSVCIYGALDAIADASTANAAGYAIRDYVGTGDAAIWNDTPGRTKAEVLKAMRGAALASSVCGKD